MKIAKVVNALEQFAPLPLQEDYDNAGLQTGLTEADVSGALLCLDVTEAVVDEAVAKGCNLIVSHHPLIFHKLRRLCGEDEVQRTVMKAIEKHITILSLHTNMDAVEGGVNFKIAEKLGLEHPTFFGKRQSAEVRTPDGQTRTVAGGEGVIAGWTEPLAADDFIYGKQPLFKLTKKHRLPGVGTIEACLEIKDNHIHDIDLFGDYFLTGDLDEELLPRLRDVAFTREAVEKALQGLDLNNIIRGLTTDGLLRVLFGRKPHVIKPDWLKIDLSSGQKSENTSEIIHGNRLHTICESGLCPNRAECWRLGTATLMIGGDICTRHCRFCNTLSGRPLPLDPDEPQRVAESVKEMNLRYVVLTSVDRDDLPDMGAEHWHRTIEAVRQRCQTKIEVLLPDFQGRDDLMDIVLESHPDVVAHNIETVRRLTPSVRSVATYDGSLHVLKHIHDSGFVTKSGLMLGLGETEEEVLQTLRDLRDCGVERVTIGQYLQPTTRHLPVEAYITPEKFQWYHEQALQMGFRSAVCGPLVRSSYKASIG